MKYSDLISIDESFDSTFNVVAEQENHWKTFISNKHFESNLAKVVASLSATERNQRKSIWVQGTYGTGKSHSTSVIKHLLCDDKEKIQDYLPKIQDPQVRERVRNFREGKRVYPVVLRGVYAITDSADMMYVIQDQVMRSLEANDIHIATKSDIEMMVERVNDPKLSSFWDSLLQGPLHSYVDRKEDIVQKLTQNVPDISLLRLIVDQFKASNLASFTRNIDLWLKEVKCELDNLGIADYLMIFWDEFTSLLEKAERRSLLNTLQDIAELSKIEEEGKPLGIYIYVVTHKDLEATEAFKDLKADEKRMALDRFHVLHYDMQPYTTYHILSGAIQQNKPNEMKNLVLTNYTGKPSVMDVLDKVVDNTAENVGEIKDRIISLYPFHPYAAYLSTFVSRTMGSAERSIFEFLNDPDKGFRKFIENEVSNPPFLTASYVWDFFQNIFEEDSSSKFDVVTSKYKMHIDKVAEAGQMYEEVFKVVLLLNILYRVTATEDEFTESSLVKPKEENIIAAFSGVYDISDVQKCLSFLDNEQILIRSPDGVFEVSFSTLPAQRVAAEIKRVYPQNEDISKIVEGYAITCKNPLNNNLSTSITRPCDVQCFWGGEKDQTLRSKLTTRFTSSYSLKIAVLLFRGETPDLDTLIGRSERSKQSAIDSFVALSKEDEFKDIVFISANAELGKRRFKQYVESIARFTVADSMKMTEEANDSKANAEKWIKIWIKEDVLSGTARLIFRGDNTEMTFIALSKRIADSFVPQIFEWGLEKVEDAQANTIWKKQKAKNAVEGALVSPDRQTLESTKWTGTASNLKALLKDNSKNYIFDEKLEIIPGADQFNPVVHLCEEVTARIQKLQTEAAVDLSHEFVFLREPQYGYFQNHVSMGAVALAFRPYVGKLYRSGNGQLIDQTGMRDIIVQMFEYWDSNKKSDECIVRFSTEEERELVTCLNGLFGISADSLIKGKWILREEFAKKNRSPLWSLKYAVNEGQEFNDLVDQLFWFVKTTDENIQQKHIQELLSQIKSLRIELSQALKSIENSNCIEAFLKLCLKDVNSSQPDMVELFKYLEQNLAEKKSLWEEKDVRAAVYKWEAQKSTQTTVVPGTSTAATSVDRGTQTFGGGVPTTGGEPIGSDSSISRATGPDDVCKKITDYAGGANNLKALLIKLYQKYSYLGAEIDSLLDDM